MGTHLVASLGWFWSVARSQLSASWSRSGHWTCRQDSLPLARSEWTTLSQWSALLSTSLQPLHRADFSAWIHLQGRLPFPLSTQEQRSSAAWRASWSIFRAVSPVWGPLCCLPDCRSRQRPLPVSPLGNWWNHSLEFTPGLSKNCWDFLVLASNYWPYLKFSPHPLLARLGFMSFSCKTSSANLFAYCA